MTNNADFSQATGYSGPGYPVPWIFLACILAWPGLLFGPSGMARGAEKTRPNILWIVVDDMSPNFSCYGEKSIVTPQVDALAQNGVMFTRAYATAPVCSSFRSSLITGMYQNTIGAHHHRSGRGEHRVKLPEGVRPIPLLLQEAGYYTCIGSGLPGFDHRGLKTAKVQLGKTDYNFDWDAAMYHSHDWAGRKEGQPFFMQAQLHGGKLRGDSAETCEELAARMDRDFGGRTDPEKAALPPHYPRDPVLLKDWAAYLDSARVTDWQVGELIKRLRDEGLLANTLVVFFTDHGVSHARGKQFLYDEGTRIPLVVSGPGVDRGEIRDDLVESIDIAALTLAAAGIELPERMEGQDILEVNYQPKEAVFAARDRCGEAADRIRSVRSEEYLYIKNFHPKRPLLMPNEYKDSKLIVQRLRELHAAGSLPAEPEQLLFAPVRPAEELYRYGADPWQHRNLAASPEHAGALEIHRGLLQSWIEETRDPGPETPHVYLQETADQLKSMKGRAAEIYRQNVEIYRKWQAEGK